MNERKAEKQADDTKIARERLEDDHGRERGGEMAPQQNRAPAEQHRSGPLPNQKK